MIVTTIYELQGVRTDDDTKKVKNLVYDVPDVGAVAFEVTDAETKMFIKHTDDVTPDRAALERAVSTAGSYRLL